ncbi:hypothetical protein [Singulisphaera acidiphila]|uniref:Uncharacterized protein n=1 Tax=Singulisphaera acidiphila (strain ATCC BAA-1392 / DSM 18658 / VKM B-2454 / MOB10) TaxID=886293 RepID=L0DF08_SINAD|nr:hypothetical protein [Singulisphaera acidiphila]AGA27266.1 hypothetical protein Sinac_2982 [Singulisphaera acidiphila DSM 18658]
MQPHLGRILIALVMSGSLLGCHGPDRVGSDDGGGLVNVRTKNGVHVRAPFVNVHVATRNPEERAEVNPPSNPPAELTPRDLGQGEP